MNVKRVAFSCALVFALAGAPLADDAATGRAPDGRLLTPAGFTIPVESFSSSLALSPDGALLAVLSQDAGAIDIIDSHSSMLVERLRAPSATAMVWTLDGLYIARGHTGIVDRYAYAYVRAKHGGGATFTPRAALKLGPGLLNGVFEDPATHRVYVTRANDRQVVALDDQSDATVATLATSGQPFAVTLANGTIFASLYDSDHVDAFAAGATQPTRIPTGPHPTALLAAGNALYVANADGNDVAVVDASKLTVVRRISLGVPGRSLAGQTPSGMTLSSDGTQLFVAESGFNDVAVVDLASARVLARIPAAWYPMSVAYALRPTGGKKDPRPKAQLWILSAEGLGAQPNPGGEDNYVYTGLVQHLLVEPARFAAWSAQVARNDRFSRAAPAGAAPQSLPPIRHIVFIVRENKHFDEEFGDEPRANGDPLLVLYGRTFTPNAHRLAERYTLFDDFDGNGDASVYGHAWTTQGMVNDYHERNGHARDESADPPLAAYAIWPYPFGGDDSVPAADMDFDWFSNLAGLTHQPRINPSGVFGPRGELIDELQRKHVSFRVYGEQMTMQPDGTIVPGLAAHAARDYPGDHINFGILDTERAARFLGDLARHGLAQYTYLTLPTDHTAGTAPGFYTPASYVADNDVALGRIIAGLSKRPEWQSTVVFVTTDDPQGTGDHLDSHRMPAFAVGPYVRHGFVDHTHYSIPSILRTVEITFGLDPLNIYDASATPMTAAFAKEPQNAVYTPLPSNIPIVKNPGSAASTFFEIDGPDSDAIPAQEWASLRGPRSLATHEAYLRALARSGVLAAAGDR